jgi:N-acetylneuraminate synthase
MNPIPVNIDGFRRIGPGQPCFIIAEAGVNHNGSLALARELIDAARAAGADAVKFQTWITEKLTLPDTQLADYQRANAGPGQTQFEMIRQLELRPEDFAALKAHALTAGILFFSTPDEEDSADFLQRLGVPLFKIGSGEVTNLPYLRHVAAKGRPLVLSTGMSTLGEVEAAVDAIRGAGNTDLILLHCVSDYPARPEDCNLRAMATLQAAFGCPVGFSDHTLGVEVAVAAVALGACVLEKHLTLDHDMAGPDHRASMEPREFADMVRAVRRIECALGTGIKQPVQVEVKTRETVRKSLVTARPVRQGERLESGAVALRRASGGLPPHFLDVVLGRRAKQDLAANRVIELDMLA